MCIINIKTKGFYQFTSQSINKYYNNRIMKYCLILMLTVICSNTHAQNTSPALNKTKVNQQNASPKITKAHPQLRSAATTNSQTSKHQPQSSLTTNSQVPKAPPATGKTAISGSAQANHSQPRTKEAASDNTTQIKMVRSTVNEEDRKFLTAEIRKFAKETFGNDSDKDIQEDQFKNAAEIFEFRLGAKPEDPAVIKRLLESSGPQVVQVLRSKFLKYFPQFKIVVLSAISTTGAPVGMEFHCMDGDSVSYYSETQKNG